MMTHTTKVGPADENAVVSEVDALVNASDIPRAVERARNALDRGVVHPLLLNLRAHWFREQGRYAEALNDLEQAVRIAPGDALIQYAYGQTFARIEKFVEAAEAFEKTVSLAPQFAPPHYNLGWARIQLGEIEAAEQSFRRGLQIDPDYALAWAQLAGIAATRGQFKEAHALADRALSIDPNLHCAMLEHATTALAERDLDSAEAWLTGRIMNDPSVSPRERARAKSKLGDLRDAQGRYDEAFAAYSESAAEEYAIYAPVFDRPGAETAYSYAVWLAEYFGKCQTADWSVKARRGTVPPDPRDGALGHIFLVGFPRSGTTLLDSILSSHPGIVALEERRTLNEAISVFLSNARGRDRLAHITPAEVAEHRALYWRNVRGQGVQVEGKIFVDRHPLHSTKLPLIARLFPDARILFLIRDPRDVVLSCFRRNFTMNSSMFEFLSLQRTARFYDIVMRLRETYIQKLEMDWFDLRLEDLIEDFDSTARATCAFLGVAWDERLRNFAEMAKDRRIATPSATQVIRGLNREGIGPWRNYRRHIEPVLPMLAPWIEKFGYTK